MYFNIISSHTTNGGESFGVVMANLLNCNILVSKFKLQLWYYIYYQWLVGWWFEFYSISTFVGYLMPNPFFM